MSYRFLPRFYYSFPLPTYLRSLFPGRKSLDLPEFLNVERIYFFNYARTGLRLLLSSFGSGPMTIGVQAFTCQTVFQSIIKAGHKIAFLDIDDNLRLVKEDLVKKLPGIDAIILTHTFGFPDDVKAIKEIAGEKIIIEDCAHAYMSRIDNNYTGTIGDAAIFSFGLGKLPPIGQGGLVMINNPSVFPGYHDEYEKLSPEPVFSELIHILRMLAYSIVLRPPFYGLVAYKLGKKLDKRLDFMKKNNSLESTGFRFDRRFFLRNQFIFHDLLQANNKNFDRLDLKISPAIRPPSVQKNTCPNYYAVPILSENREELIRTLTENGFECGRHFGNSITWASNYGYQTGDCPNTEKIVRELLTIPAHRGIKTKNIAKLSLLINEIE